MAATLVVSACVNTVEGTATRQLAGQDLNSADVPPLDEADLDDVLLTIGELNDIVGSTRMRVTLEVDEMSDHSGDVSDLDCLGAIYGAEEMVYAGSGWTAVRDQVAREPDDDNDHWVEQAAVLYPSAADAREFFDSSSAAWQDCAYGTTTVGDGDYEWELEGVDVSDTMITQSATQEGAEGWACQHALSLVSNLTVEAWACSYSISDEAEQIASAMIENAAGR
ncbi:MAG: sensor domain-containing protein [Actinomycetia bacterium]|nr:sensor domain-containing protein [Actinomycetes bacterium]MCH9703021.1 sensor domain-containing protein [Actinomycetes bacterium]MCH9759127.1 sensor domain-containing protein [Actinomycetes bacterium]